MPAIVVDRAARGRYRRAGMSRAVFMSEEMEQTHRDGTWLTGRFTGALNGHEGGRDDFRGLPLDEALAWARARADRIVIRHGDEPGVQYEAGTVQAPGLPRWPPPDLPALVRRRAPEDRWRDRTADDPPIAWAVELELRPPDTEGVPLSALAARRPAWCATVAGLAERVGGAWDADLFDTLVADLRAAQEAAGGAEDFGWMSYGHVALRVHLTIETATAGGAELTAEHRIAPPPGWHAEARARPA